MREACKAFLEDTLKKLLGQNSHTGFTKKVVTAAEDIAREQGVKRSADIYPHYGRMRVPPGTPVWIAGQPSTWNWPDSTKNALPKRWNPLMEGKVSSDEKGVRPDSNGAPWIICLYGDQGGKG